MPSEQINTYRLLSDEMEHKGVDAETEALEHIACMMGVSFKTAQRLKNLSNLSKELINLLDTRKLPIRGGVQLSYLSSQEQEIVESIYNKTSAKITESKAKALRDLSDKSIFTEDTVRQVLLGSVSKQEKITIARDELIEYFGDEVSNEQIVKKILCILDDWKANKKL